MRRFRCFLPFDVVARLQVEVDLRALALDVRDVGAWRRGTGSEEYTLMNNETSIAGLSLLVCVGLNANAW